MNVAWRVVSIGLEVLLGGALFVGCGGDEPAASSGGAPSGGGGSTGKSGAGGSTSPGGTGGSGESGSGGSTSTAGMAGEGPMNPEPEGCVSDAVALSEAPGAVVLAGEATNQTFGVVQVGTDHVFVTTDLGIERVSKQGGATELVMGVEGSDPPRFRIGGDNLYFIQAGSLYSVPTTATDATATLVAADVGIDEPSDALLVIDAGYAYLWARATRATTRLELASGQITPVVEGSSNIAWHIYDGFMYYGTQYDSINRVPLEGGEPELVVNPQAVVWSLAVGAEGLFIGSYGAIYAQAEPLRVAVFEDPDASRIYIERVAIHGDQLLFTGGAIGDNRVGWVKIDGSSCATFGSNAFYDEWGFDEANLYVGGGDLLYKIPL